MTIEDKMAIDSSPAVERGGIYKFIEKDGSSEKLALVVAGTHRCRDRFVSILILKPHDGAYGLHGDEVLVVTPNGEFMVHCGMVTYVRRDRLGKMIHKISKAARHRINEQLKIELGMVGRLTVVDKDPEPDYKALYEQLVDFFKGGKR